jgi:hypothetical protein
MTALLAEVGPPIAALIFGFGWSFGHRSGVQRERERSSKRAVQMMETRRTIEKAAR